MVPSTGGVQDIDLFQMAMKPKFLAGTSFLGRFATQMVGPGKKFGFHGHLYRGSLTRPRALGTLALLPALQLALYRSDWVVRATKKKKRLTSRDFSRFAARTWPLEPDFGSPGRSRARFLKPKRVDFQSFSPRALVRVLVRSKPTKHCKN